MIKVNEVFNTNSCGYLRVKNYISAKEILVEFVSTGYLTTVSSDQLRRGRVSDKLKPSLYGVGYLGTGGFKTKGTLVYSTWSGMIRRCYSGEILKFPSYQDCTVCKEWQNYSIFNNWFTLNSKEGLELDKDLTLIGNKIYSPTTCTFVPKDVNSLLTDSRKARRALPLGVSPKGNKFRAQCDTNLGRERWRSSTVSCPIEAFKLYKSKKELVIKEVAEYYKLRLPEKVYSNLIAYEVTDDSVMEAHLKI